MASPVSQLELFEDEPQLPDMAPVESLKLVDRRRSQSLAKIVSPAGGKEVAGQGTARAPALPGVVADAAQAAERGDPAESPGEDLEAGATAVAAPQPEEGAPGGAVQRRVSNKRGEKLDWNVMRGQPPLPWWQALLWFPLLLVRLVLGLLAVLQLALFYQLSRACCNLAFLLTLGQAGGTKRWNAARTLLGRASSALLLPLLGVSTSVRWHPDCSEADRRTDTPFMVANHVCYLDALVLQTKVGRGQRFVAKAGVAGIPLLGPMIADLGTVFVDRGSSASKRAVFEAIARHGEEWRPGGAPMAVFPEGTTTSGKTLIPFKKGIFSSGKPLRPVLVVYRNGLGSWRCNRWKAGHCHFISLNDHLFKTFQTLFSDMTPDGSPAAEEEEEEQRGSDGPKEQIVAYDDVTWFKLFLSRVFVRATVVMLPIYTPSEEEKAEGEVYAENVYAMMKEKYEELKRDIVGEDW